VVNYSNVGMVPGQAAECAPETEAAYQAARRGQRGDSKCRRGHERLRGYAARPLVQRLLGRARHQGHGGDRGLGSLSLGFQITALADSVVAWSHDQSAGWTAYSRTAVADGLTMDDVAG
jgi:hypothetical protein